MVVKHIETHAAKLAVYIAGQKGITSNLLNESLVLKVVHSCCRAITWCVVSGKEQGVGTGFDMQTLVIYKLEIQIRKYVQVRLRYYGLVARKLVCNVVVPM